MGVPPRHLVGEQHPRDGVDVVAVTRAVDELLAARAVREDAGRASADLTSSTMARIEGIFPEPTDLGLAHQLDDYWGSWTDLSNNPGDMAARTQLLENARAWSTRCTVAQPTWRVCAPRRSPGSATWPSR